MWDTKFWYCMIETSMSPTKRVNVLFILEHFHWDSTCPYFFRRPSDEEEAKKISQSNFHGLEMRY